MRGTQNIYLNDTKSFRITPAHAGNTSHVPIILEFIQDHPRPCGEHPVPLSSSPVNIGSPPPMRGTRDIMKCDEIINRITPAHAGNTYHLNENTVHHQDHPRPCGEHTKKILKLGPFCAAACHNLFSSQ